MSSEWLQSESDFLIKIKKYEGRKLNMKQKQELFMARKKYLVYIETDGKL